VGLELKDEPDLLLAPLKAMFGYAENQIGITLLNG
jgi:hypothetical protein